MARGKHVGHHLFFGWGGGSPSRCSDRYLDFLWNRWRTMPKRVDPATLTVTEWDSDRARRKATAAAVRPRHPSRRSANAGQSY